jgi:acetyl esterase
VELEVRLPKAELLGHLLDAPHPVTSGFGVARSGTHPTQERTSQERAVWRVFGYIGFPVGGYGMKGSAAITRRQRSIFAALLVAALALLGTAAPASAQQSGGGSNNSGESQLAKCAGKNPPGTQAIAGGGQVTYDIPYVTGAGTDRQGDIYIPAGTGPFPAIVLLHGGGWTVGDKCWLSTQSMSLEQSGFVAFTINYRLAPTFCFPVPEEDAAAAIAYLRQNASTYKVDPAKIGILGTSAGGQIAAMTAYREGFGSTGSNVAAIASWSGAFDMIKIIQERPGSDEVQVRERTASCLPENASVTAPSSVAKLDAASIASQKLTPNFPPTFIANAVTEFIPLDQAEAFHQELQGLGVPTQLITPPQGHATQYTREAIQPTIDFFDQHVKNVNDGPPPSDQPSPQPSHTPAGTPPIALGPAGRSNTVVLVLVLVVAGVVIVGGLLAGPAFTSWKRSRAQRA